MDNISPPESLRVMIEKSLRETLDKVIQEAFNAGYLKGADDVTQRVVAAAKGGAPASSQPPAARVRLEVSPAVSGSTVDHVREMHPNSADARRFPYGAVANAFREALKRAGVFGQTHADLIKMVSLTSQFTKN
jgi:hypothetical protein